MAQVIKQLVDVVTDARRENFELGLIFTPRRIDANAMTGVLGSPTTSLTLTEVELVLPSVEVAVSVISAVGLPSRS